METDIISLYHQLSTQAQTLLTELDAFKQHIQSYPQVRRPDIHLNKFHADIVREAKQLEHHGSSLKSKDDDPDLVVQGTSTHQIRSSNITHLSSIWEEVKRSAGVTGIRKQVRYTLNSSLAASASPMTSSKRSSHARQRSRNYDSREAKQQRNGKTFTIPRSDKEYVTVDVIAERGAKWIKVFTKNQRWLMMDLANEGLVDIAEDIDMDVDHELDQNLEESTDNINTGDQSIDNSALEELKLVKMAKEFLAAAKTTRVGQHHCHPAIHFHLPKIERGVFRDIDAVLSYIEETGIIVSSSNELQSRAADNQSWPITRPSVPNLSTIFNRMTSTPPTAPLTETLNIDCTLLIALVSDISHLPHSRITIPSHYDGRPSKKDIEGQMASEEVNALLPAYIYPILRGKKLVCTRTAAEHLRGIVRIMGSESETGRSNILLGYDDAANARNPKDARMDLQATSVHWVPEDLMLPFQVVDAGNGVVDEGAGVDDRPTALDAEVMRRVSTQPRLSPLNRSVFLYGWSEGLTTISLNRVVSEWLDRAVDGVLDEIEAEQGCSGDIAVEGGFVGPRVLVCGRERSLLGNEKRGNHSRADGDE